MLAAGKCSLRSICFPISYDLDLTAKDFQHLLEFHEGRLPRVILLRDAHLRGGISITGDTITQIYLEGATIDGPLSVRLRTKVNEIRCDRAKVSGEISIEAPEADALVFVQAAMERTRIRGRFQSASFVGVRVQKAIDLADCTCTGGLAFEEIRFERGAELILTGCALIGSGLTLAFAEDPPKAIHLDGTSIIHGVSIETAMGLPKPRLLAQNRPPRFRGDIRLVNVDLTGCRLVGNHLLDIILTHVTWPRRWYGPQVLYDELALRAGTRIPVGHLREAYEVLKQNFQNLGNNRTAGDFHYGEMEMRRREYGGLRRFCCPEFLYWLLSGYGVGYIRAGAMMVMLALGFGVAYWCLEPDAFFGDIRDALRFSVSVMTLQRPSVPEGMSDVGRWLQLAEAILGPLQIALFGLALRMRVRR